MGARGDDKKKKTQLFERMPGMPRNESSAPNKCHSLCFTLVTMPGKETNGAPIKSLEFNKC